MRQGPRANRDGSVSLPTNWTALAVAAGLGDTDAAMTLAALVREHDPVNDSRSEVAA
jgi:hypothetical protein